MDMNEYQMKANGTNIVEPENKQQYSIIGLISEVGELAGLYKKTIRDNTPLSMIEFKKELGDILWYVSDIATAFDMNLNEVAELNLRKLENRKERGVIRGSGNNR
jgi:NTP pyrophosphatase (non-canonical NTP hydrolase)